MTKYVEWTEKFFYHILEAEIRKYDKSTPYTPTSPVGEKHNYGVGSDNVGDTHLWAVWHGLKPMNYYRKRMTRFCSEFGFESLPDMKSIDIFAEHKGNYRLMIRCLMPTKNVQTVMIKWFTMLLLALICRRILRIWFIFLKLLKMNV